MHIFEQSFNESIRRVLEIERQWLKINQHLEQKMSSDHAMFLLGEVVKLMAILDRSDVKVKLMTELSIAQSKALRLMKNELIGEQDYVEFEQSCKQTTKRLSMTSRLLSKPLMEDPLLSSLFHKQISIDQSFYCDTWCRQSEESRKLQFSYWIEQVSIVYHAVRLILWVTRASVPFKQIEIQSGFYRDSMIGRDVMDVSIVRVQCHDPLVYPTVSIAKHWVALTINEGCWANGMYQSFNRKEPTTLGLAICF